MKSALCLLLLLASTRLLVADAASVVITTQEYVLFLQQNAASDVRSLFDEKMSTDLGSSCIQRSGSPGNYSYALLSEKKELAASTPALFLTAENAACYERWKNKNDASNQKENSSSNFKHVHVESLAAEALADNVSADPELRSTEIYFSASSIPRLSMAPLPVETAVGEVLSAVEEMGEVAAVVLFGIVGDGVGLGHDGCSESDARPFSFTRESSEIDEPCMDSSTHFLPNRLNNAPSVSDADFLDAEKFDFEHSTLFYGHDIHVVDHHGSSSSSSELGKRKASPSVLDECLKDYLEELSHSSSAPGDESANSFSAEAGVALNGDEQASFEEKSKLLQCLEKLQENGMSKKEAQQAVIAEIIKPKILAKIITDKDANPGLNLHSVQYRNKYTSRIYAYLNALGLKNVRERYSSIFTEVLNEHFPLAKKELSAEQEEIRQCFNEKIASGMSEEEAREVVIQEKLKLKVLAIITEDKNKSSSLNLRCEKYRNKFQKVIYSYLAAIGVSNPGKQVGSILTEILNEYFPLKEKELSDEKLKKIRQCFDEKIANGMSNEAAYELVVKEELFKKIIECTTQGLDPQSKECIKTLQSLAYNIQRALGISIDAAKGNKYRFVMKALNEKFPK